MLRLPATDLGRLMLAIGSAAIGVTALRSSSPFWLGVVAMLIVAWMLMAALNAFIARGRDRLFWIGFLLSGSFALMVSFGPWSDRSERAAWPEGTRWKAQSKRVHPTSRLLVQLMPLVRPTARAQITLGDDPLAVRTSVEVTSRFEGLDSQDQLKDQVARLAARLPFPSPPGTPRSRAQLANDTLRDSLSMADYQGIGHLLVALLAASTGGMIAKLGAPANWLGAADAPLLA